MNSPAGATPARVSGGKKAAAAIGLAGLAVGFIAGYGAGRVSTGTPINPLVESKGGYEAGYKAAMRKIADAGLLPQAPESSTSLQGTVTAVEAGRLTFEADVLTFDPLGVKNLPKERVAIVTDATVVTRLEAMPASELQAAQRAYEQALAKYEPDPENPSLPPVPPSGYKEVPIAAGDLKPGDRVVVTAAGDILKDASFDAVTIAVLTDGAIGTSPAPATAPAAAPELPTPPEDPNRPDDGASAPREEAPRI